MAASNNRFASELNEKEAIEILENATPGGIKKATKCGMKIFLGNFIWMLLIPGTGNGERGTGNGSLGSNVQRQPASEFKMAVKTKERLEEKQFG